MARESTVAYRTQQEPCTNAPRRTRARSYSGQFATWYLVLYFGWILDFTSRSCPFGRHDGQNTECSPLIQPSPRTNAASRRGTHLGAPGRCYRGGIPAARNLDSSTGSLV